MSASRRRSPGRGRLAGRGEADHVLGPAEDGVVFPDEHVSQDPQVAASGPYAAAAAVVLGLGGEGGREREREGGGERGRERRETPVREGLSSWAVFLFKR